MNHYFSIALEDKSRKILDTTRVERCPDLKSAFIKVACVVWPDAPPEYILYLKDTNDTNTLPYAVKVGKVRDYANNSGGFGFSEKRQQQQQQQRQVVIESPPSETVRKSPTKLQLTNNYGLLAASATTITSIWENLLLDFPTGRVSQTDPSLEERDYLEHPTRTITSWFIMKTLWDREENQNTNGVFAKNKLAQLFFSSKTCTDGDGEEQDVTGAMLVDWAASHPYLWGNIHGRDLFTGAQAYGVLEGDWTLTSVYNHWYSMTDRLEKNATLK